MTGRVILYWKRVEDTRMLVPIYEGVTMQNGDALRHWEDEDGYHAEIVRADGTVETLEVDDPRDR